MRLVRLSLSAIALSIGLAFAPPALADTLVVEATPSLGAPALAGQPGPTYSLAAGSSIQLVVRLEATNGTSTDVTTDTETQFLAYRPSSVSVDSDGVVTAHAAPSGAQSPIVAVLRNDQMATITFQVIAP